MIDYLQGGRLTCGCCGFQTRSIDDFIDHQLLAVHTPWPQSIIENDFLFWYRLALIQLVLETQKAHHEAA